MLCTSGDRKYTIAANDDCYIALQCKENVQLGLQATLTRAPARSTVDVTLAHSRCSCCSLALSTLPEYTSCTNGMQVWIRLSNQTMMH